MRSSGRGKGGADADFDPFGHAFADEQVVFVAGVLDDVFVHFIAGHADGAFDDDAAHGEDGHFGGAAADIDDHAAPRFDDGQTGADGRGHRFFDEIGFARAGGDGGVVDGPFFHFGHAAGHADDDARAGEGDDHLLVGFFDEVVEHRFGDFKFGDDAVAQRPYRHNIARGAPHHFPGFRANRQRPSGAFIDRHPGRFVDDNPPVANIDQRICRA